MPNIPLIFFIVPAPEKSKAGTSKGWIRCQVLSIPNDKVGSILSEGTRWLQTTRSKQGRIDSSNGANSIIGTKCGEKIGIFK